MFSVVSNLPAEGVFASGSKTQSATVQNMSPGQRRRRNSLTGQARADYTRSVTKRNARGAARASEAKRLARNARARERRAGR